MTRNDEIVGEVRWVRNEHAEKFAYGECRDKQLSNSVYADKVAIEMLAGEILVPGLTQAETI